LGKGEQSILKQLRPHEKVPDWIRNKPVLREDLMFYYIAFNDLDSTRGIGFAAGPIPWTAIRTYADAAKVYDVDFDLLVHYVRKLDAAFLTFIQPKDKK
jgi:hypothetical protein